MNRDVIREGLCIASSWPGSSEHNGIGAWIYKRGGRMLQHRDAAAIIEIPTPGCTAVCAGGSIGKLYDKRSAALGNISRKIGRGLRIGCSRKQ